MAKRMIPTLNRVLVEKILPPSKTASGILLPEKTTKLNSGKVGTGAVAVKEGDTVLLQDYGGMEVKLGEKESHGYHGIAFRACCSKLDNVTNSLEHGVETCNTTQIVSGGYTLLPKSFYGSQSSTAKFSSGNRGLSSQAGKESNAEDDDLENGFSELETHNSDVIEEKTVESNNDLVSEPELSDDDDDDDVEDSLAEDSNELDLSDITPSTKRMSLELFRVISSANRNSLNTDLSKWEQEGNSFDRSEISLAMLNLRKRRMYGTALQFSDWLDTNNKIVYDERDYASRLDLIAKVHGLHKAEKYIGNIPESFRGEVVYRTLLANCVTPSNLKKAEQVFNKMKDLGFQITAFACNQLLLLYKRFDKRKIADVLLFMEKEDIKPSFFTYKLLIDTKGQSNDIQGMEQLLETMKEQGFEPDLWTQATISKHYIHGGFTEKAEVVLKDMEGGNLNENRKACRALLTLYADLGKDNEVERVWKICDPNPRMDECLSAIEAYGKLGKVEQAEAVFEKMAKMWKKLSSRNYTALLKVYADHKMLAKGKELTKRMADSGCRIGPWTWDALVELYVEAGEVEKADSIIFKASQQNQGKPLFNSYIRVMDQYAKRGDIHNAEKMLHRLKQVGYAGRLRQYQVLLDAYIKAKVPAYGFRERMKADDVFPNHAFSVKLAQVNAFKKTAISELLE